MSTKNNIIILFTTLILLLTCMVNTSIAINMSETFEIGSDTGVPSGIVTVPINIENVSNGPIQTIDFSIDYDKSNCTLDQVTINENDMGTEWSKMVGSNGMNITLYTGSQADAIPNGSSCTVGYIDFLINNSVYEDDIDIPVNVTDIEFASTVPVSGEPENIVNGTITVTYIYPIPGFSMNTSSGHVPLTIEFTDESQQTDTYHWDFGDGYESTVQNPIHTFSECGTYVVELTASNSEGSAYINETVEVLPVPIYPDPVFDTDSISYHVGKMINFSVMDPSNIDTYDWNFSNGVTSIDSNPNITYDNIGTYNVSLNATNENGSSMYNMDIWVQDKLNENGCYLIADKYEAMNNTSISFNLLGDIDDGNITWNFDDGTIIETLSTKPIHLYNQTGEYNVSVQFNVSETPNILNKTINVSENTPDIILPENNITIVTQNENDPFNISYSCNNINCTSIYWDMDDSTTDTTSTNGICEISDQEACDNDIVNTRSLNGTYTFPGYGTYDITLYSENPNGTSINTEQISIDAPDPAPRNPGGGGGSGGGSGGGGSPEPAANVQNFELCQRHVANDLPVEFKFVNANKHSINKITYTPTSSAGQITSRIEHLYNLSASASSEPSGQVYKYMNIWIGHSNYANEENMKNVIINICVDKKWLNEHSIEKNDIQMQRYHNDTWNILPTTIDSESDDYVYYNVSTPGFSPFVITSEIDEDAIVDSSNSLDKTDNTGIRTNQNDLSGFSDYCNDGSHDIKAELDSSDVYNMFIQVIIVVCILGFISFIVFRRKLGL